MDDPADYEHEVMKYGGTLEPDNMLPFEQKFQYLGAAIDRIENRRWRWRSQLRSFAGAATLATFAAAIAAAIVHVWR